MRYVVVAALTVALWTSVIEAAAAQPAAPGTVVSVRALAATELIPSAAGGYRLTYRTTGQDGSAQVSGGTVYVPAGAPPRGGWPVVSWAHGTSGMTYGCTPSHTGGMADKFDESPHLSTYLAQGYAVAATDYIGLGAPGVYEYLAWRAAGHAVLDIVRAAHHADPALSKSFVLAGHSIGGQAALAAAQRWPNYAAELDLRGTLAYAPSSNFDGVVAALARPGVPALPGLDGLHARLVMILAGLDHARPDVRVPDHLSAHGKRMLAVARAGERCVGALEAAVAGAPVGSLFTAPLADSPVQAALHDYWTVPTGGHRRPVLLLQGATDRIQPVPTTVALQDQLQRSGADSRLALYPAADHFALLTVAAGDATAFLNAVLPAR